jgi:hypothetical protein
VIAQQIYYRYYHKQTDNPAFKDFWIVIHALHIRALKLIAHKKLKNELLRILLKNTGNFKNDHNLFGTSWAGIFWCKSYDQLSPNGELQAKLLGQYFNKILKEAPYVVAGSMQRHQQTAICFG